MYLQPASGHKPAQAAQMRAEQACVVQKEEASDGS